MRLRGEFHGLTGARAFRLTGVLDGTSPVILASPHSGTLLPAEFLANVRLPLSSVRRLEDAHVGTLLEPAAHRLQLPLLEAIHSRAAFDLNRAADELDPAMFDGPVVAAPRVTDRVRRGYGLFPRNVSGGTSIHQTRLPAAYGQDLIREVHRPWHQALRAGLATAAHRHGHALLLDFHSMPSLPGDNPAQLVLGDRNGQSAAPELMDWLEAAFAGEGLNVERNNPYAGGYTTEHHGRPAQQIHAVQIELDRALYMQSTTLAPHQGFQPLARMVDRVLEGLLCALPRLGLNNGMAQAAE